MYFLSFIPFIFPPFAPCGLAAIPDLRDRAAQSEHEITRRDQSKTERDRVSSLIESGQEFEAWRFASDALYDKDVEIRVNGGIVLLRLVGKQTCNYAPAQALIERNLIYCKYTDHREQEFLIGLYSSLETKVSRGDLNAEAYAKSMKLADEALSTGRLPSGAVLFCNEILAGADPRNRRAAINIILVASRLSKTDRAWSLATCQKQLRKVPADHTTVWKILFETLTGRFLARLR